MKKISSLVRKILSEVTKCLHGGTELKNERENIS